MAFLCYRCHKPVYFAEQTIALSKHWHKQCFACTQCDKVLYPGNFSEHGGLPYCNKPCYLVLFGPNIYLQGASAEAHDNQYNQSLNMLPRASVRPDVVLPQKLKAFNDFYANNPAQQIKSVEMKGQLIMVGQLRVYWGLQHPIHFQQMDETATLEPDFVQDVSFDDGEFENDTMMSKRCSRTRIRPGRCTNGDDPSKYVSVMIRGSDISGVKGGEVKLRRVKKRQSILNGHIYNVETSIFVPTFGSVTNVTVGSLDSTSKVVQLLLDKFKIVNIGDNYSLCLVKCNGETQTLKECQYPLLERIIFGPNEEDGKIFIMEKNRVSDITQEVAQFINLPESMLYGFLEKLKRDEEYELALIKQRHNKYRQKVEERLAQFSGSYL